MAASGSSPPRARGRCACSPLAGCEPSGRCRPTPARSPSSRWPSEASAPALMPGLIVAGFRALCRNPATITSGLKLRRNRARDLPRRLRSDLLRLRAVCSLSILPSARRLFCPLLFSFPLPEPLMMSVAAPNGRHVQCRAWRRGGRCRSRPILQGPGQARPAPSPGPALPCDKISPARRRWRPDPPLCGGWGGVTARRGPTGAGKTPLLRTFNRMNDKVTGYRHAGDVLLDGRSIWHHGVELMTLRRKVGMLFQRPNPFPMSIMDNVVAGVKAHRMASRQGRRAIAQEWLTEVGLWDAVSDRLKDSPFRLSGGQQQLLCLARALAIGPDVLLLDEPTSSLDPVATESIEALIRDLIPQLTVIIVTHNLAQASRVADRTIFLNAGRLVEQGETRQIFENPAEEETARYVAGRFG